MHMYITEFRQIIMTTTSIRPTISFVTVLIVSLVAGTCAAIAGDDESRLFRIPGTDYEVILGNADFRSSASRPTEELLNAIVTWISSNFDLPAIYDHPRVELATPMKMAALRYRGLVSDRQPRAAAGLDRAMPLDLGDGIVAIYDDANKTIYLPERWTGATPTFVSAGSWSV